MCNCGFKNIEGAKYCSNCGGKLEIPKKIESFKIPKMVTVKEAREIIFNKTVSVSKIYDLVKTKSIPHVRAGNRILLDVEKTIDWWNQEIGDSMKEVKDLKIRRII